jgi:hypothetical protein
MWKNRPLLRIGPVIRPFAALAAVGACAAPLLGEPGTATLALEKVREVSRWNPARAAEYVFRYVQPQGSWMQVGAERMDDSAKRFAAAVQKQPDKYECEHPFRGVVKLGDKDYGFVFDSTKLTGGYDRLRFDVNGNGDLTDDAVVKAGSGGSWGTSAHREFPRVDLSVPVDGKTLEYAFIASVYSDMGEHNKYASASFNAAAYRHGTITIDGKEHRIFLLDFNSNGRFDDCASVPENVETSNGVVYAQMGDMLILDPDLSGNSFYWNVTAGNARQSVSKLACVDGKYYDLAISPRGDKVTFTPSSVALGSITNAAYKFRAVLYGEQGFVKVVGGEGKPIPVPAGEWKLLSYTIDLTGKPAAKKEAEAKPAAEKKEAKKKGSLFERLATAVFGSGGSIVGPPRYTMVSASATKDCKAVTVGKGQTAKLPFGPPFRPNVRVQYWRDDRTAQLEMQLVGVAGEVCSDLRVKGDTPPNPVFAIAAPDGEIVERGKFEYG